MSAEHSPFGQALTHPQCLQYVIDRPGVLTAVPGVQTMEHLDQVLKFPDATDEEKDYSIIGGFTADTISGTCVYCNHCQPCPAEIDIGLVRWTNTKVTQTAIVQKRRLVASARWLLSFMVFFPSWILFGDGHVLRCG